MKKATVINRRIGKHTQSAAKVGSLRKRVGGLTQEQAAQRVGISRRYWIQLENGENLPSAKMRDRIATAFGVEPSELQSADDEEEAARMALSRDNVLNALIDALQVIKAGAEA